MKLHPRDLEAARTLCPALDAFPVLTEQQRRTLRDEARRHVAWSAAHPGLHDAIGASVLLVLFAADLAVLWGLPALADAHWLAEGLLAGAVHGWLVTGIVTYSVHEGAAHDRVVVGQGPVSRALRLVANNACRLFLADPAYYREGHADHHRAFGTADDGSFSSHVRLGRLLLALLPLAPLASLSDFFPWRPVEWTPSRTLSHRLTLAWTAVLLVPAALFHGVGYALVAVLVVGAWLSFALDRVRESVEHLHLPLDRWHGTRDLGLGPWGLLLGGGPWGQPCHLCHHLEPALAWWQQLALHRTLRRVLTREQRRELLLRPVVGFPALALRLVVHGR